MKIYQILERAVLLSVIAISITAAVTAINIKIGFATVASGSMEPTFSAGDLIITRAIDKDSISINDVLVLPYPRNHKFQFSHRVTQIESGASGPVITTKGDANPRSDNWALEITSGKVRKVITALPTSTIRQNLGHKEIALGTFFLVAMYLGGRFTRERKQLK